MFESLESRVLFAGAKVDLVIADNRGEVHIRLSDSVQPTMVNRNSVQMYTAGSDNIMGTSDDVRVVPRLRYIEAENRIVMRADLPANTPYRVKLVATRMRDDTLTPIDGDFTGTFPSGNGRAGGNFEFKAVADSSNRPTTRWSTSAGVMNVTMFKDSTPGNVANLLNYADNARYDNIFFTRTEPGFVIQGGGLRINSSTNEVEDYTPFAAVNGEPGVSNTRGRLSLALSGSPNSGTNEFFFNIGNNTGLDVESGGSGPFTAFGEINSAAGLATMDAIGGATSINFANLTPALSFPGTLTTTVPVKAGANPVVNGLNPQANLIVIRRVSLLYQIAAL